MRSNRWLRCVITCLLAVCATGAFALPLSSGGNPLRVEFNLRPFETPLFELPAVLMSYTVSFDGDYFNYGETLLIETYASDGTFLGSGSFTSPYFGNVRGCACWDYDLVEPLTQPHFYAMLYSMSGTFNVTEVFAGAYERNDGLGEHTFTSGVIHRAPEPGTLALLGLGLAGLAFTRRRNQ